MRSSLRNSLIAGVLCIVGSAEARLPVHNELWPRIYISHEFTPKIRAEIEYQFRLQDTPGSNGFPTHRLQQGFRIWSYYKINPSWNVGLSPFCLFRAYPLINTAADFSGNSSTELRFATNSEWKADALFSEVKFRLGYESRHFNVDDSDDWTRKDRFRIRALLTIPLMKTDSSAAKLSAFFGDEYFFQGEDLFTKNVQFDQNRIIGGLTYKASSRLKLDLIYMHVLRANARGDYIERVVWLNTTIYL